MSESVLDHGYIPEEHAPDPVIGHGDPTPPGKIAIWLFLASEIMFFIGILGTYIILRSGATDLFAKHAEILSKPLAGVNTIVLIFSSLTMALAVDAAQKGNRRKLIVCLGLTLLCALGFMGIKAIEYEAKFVHHTIVAKDATDGITYAYDGHAHHGEHGTVELTGWRMPLDGRAGFNIHLVSEHDVKTSAQAAGQSDEKTYSIPETNIAQDITYGPWKNIFYSCYFALTGVHGLHVIGGIIPIFFLMVHAIRGRIMAPATEYVGLYWHFVDLVWIFLFPLLYLI